MGPIIEATEAMVLVVGGDNKMWKDNVRSSNNSNTNNDGDWYERSDLNASTMHLMKNLRRKEDCPWLTKAIVYFAAPAAVVATTGNDGNIPSLESIVDAFISACPGNTNNSYYVLLVTINHMFLYSKFSHRNS